MANKGAKRKLVARGQRMDPKNKDEVLQGDYAEFLQVEVRKDSAVELAPERAADAESIGLVASEDDVVELTLEDNLKLFTSMQRLQEEIIPQDAQRGGAADEYLVPRRLTFTSQRSRGEDGLTVKSIELLDIKGKLVDHVTGKAAAFTARKLAEAMENKLVGDGSVVSISKANNKNKDDSGFNAFNPDDIDVNQPVLLFLHGTASSTAGSFSELWSRSNDDTWKSIQKKYGNNILALQHRTLTESPIDNALTLLEALPEKITLHLVSHSRGGLVGELLCRGQLSNSREPFSKEDIDLFETDGPSGLKALQKEVQKDYRHHRKQLQRLNTLLIEKQPQVQRFVRVACPARGTTLASGKLDIYLSGILNVIGLIPFLKTSPIYSFLKTFTLAVAKERTHPQQLPGLEAMMPGSPLIAMLNTVPASSGAPLCVIEGDTVPSGILKKIALFFLDQFYASDHDLVVNTPSMDGGARRTRPVPVLFDQGKEVNHFQYFSNKRTREGMLTALTDSTMPPAGFQLRRQKPKSIARSVPRGRASGEVPTVIILPGLTGSHLAVDNNRIWVDPFDLLRGKFTRLKFDADDVTAQEVIAGPYGDLADYLSSSYEVIPVPYDWRRPLIESGLKLAGVVDERLRNCDQPLRIIAHSMGGLVFRSMAAHKPEVWEKMKARSGSRVLMLGTPNRGSWSIPRIFARQDRLVKILAAADLRHDQDELLDVLRGFQGMLELLPLDQINQIPDDSMWESFDDVLGSKWKRPTMTVLNKVQDNWASLQSKGLEPTHVFYIAGHADETPVEVNIDKTGKTKKIRFMSTSQGDGQVPWTTGIPTGARHWFVDAVHGDIPDHEPSFEGIKQVLETGNTQLLSSRAPVSRGKQELREMLPDQVDLYPGKEAIYAAAMGKAPEGRRSREPKLRPVKVSMMHGDLCFTKYPLAVGHYKGDTIVSAEAALDARMNKRLSKRLQLGIYPGRLMSHDILFDLDDDVFPGAVIVGLGEVGTLTSGGLTDTFREAVLRFVVTATECGRFKNKPIRLSCLLIGTGAGGVAPRDALTSMLRAVIQANRLLAGPSFNIDHTVEAVNFIDLYEDVVVHAQHALISIAKLPEFRATITAGSSIVSGEGGLRRVYFDEDPAWWQRLRVESIADGSMKITALTSGGARAEMITQPIQRRSVEPFLKAMTADTSSSGKAGRTLFELLVPREFKIHAPDNQDLVLVVDEGTAIYPWELLEYAGYDGNESMAKKSGMIRQLASQESDQSVICSNRQALVIGDPLVEGGDFIELPGAQTEAKIVAALLGENSYSIPQGGALIKPGGAEILTALMTDEYQILHLAGHGVVDYPLKDEEDNNRQSDCREQHKQKRVTGMVIGKNHFLTPIEIRQMPATPAFVFINCCHLGAINGTSGKHQDQPQRLAANLATQLIRQGVRAVIAAGWAVDDDAAQTFAREFYQSFLSGATFGEAVKKARTETCDKHSSVNTWGAYQCYGDPGYTLKGVEGAGGKGTKRGYVSLAEYITAANNIAERAKTASRSYIDVLREELKTTAEEIQDNWKNSARLLEAVGLAWGELEEFEKAIEACRKALGANLSSVSIRCVEQLANFEARYAVKLAESGDQKRANGYIKEARERIEGLNSMFRETVERMALLGSVYKRSAMVHRHNKKSRDAALIKMCGVYGQSHQLALASRGAVAPYPLTNWFTARWLLKKAGVKIPDANKPGATKTDKMEDFEDLLGQAIKNTAVSDAEFNREHFWDAVAESDCNFLGALVQENLAENVDAIADRYLKVKKVASSPRQFSSVIEHLVILGSIMQSLGLESDVQQIDKLVHKLRDGV